MADYTISKIELPNGDICNIKDTWRGIQDNLTSSSNTTESLSAKQGYLLANGSARDNTKVPTSMLQVTTTTSVGLEPTTNTFGYISGLTKANWNYQETDGILYTQFYNDSWKHQIFGDYRTGQISVRGKNSGTWKNWRRVLDETNARTLLGVTDNSSNADVTSSDTNLITARTLYYQLAKKGYTTNTGTVTSVAASGSGGITISGSPITTSGTIAIGLNLSTAINDLGEGTSQATGEDYLVAQYAGGGTTTTTYHRRKVSKVVNATVVKTALGTNSTHSNQFLRKDGTWQTPPYPVTSVAGNTGAITADTLRTSLGLSNAMHFRGIATVAITDGSTTDPTISGYTFGTNGASAVAGDVIIDKDSSFEYVWSGSKWERLGGDSSYKTVQTAVSDPTAANTTSTTFIDTISQNTNGVISATKKTLPDYLLKSGGTMTGDLTFSTTSDIYYQGTQGKYRMIRFIDNTGDIYGNGISIGGGGTTIIGGGESANVIVEQVRSGGNEIMYIGNDADVNIFTNLQNGWSSRQTFTFGTNGTLTATSFSGSGTSLTSLDASNISSGTLSADRLATSGATEGSYGDSAAQTPGYGSTFKVPYITVDSKGRVTSISEHTVKIPASDNTNTDTLVKQTSKSDNVNYKILTTTSASPTSGNAAEAAYSANIFANPSTGSLNAVRHSFNISGTEKAYLNFNSADSSLDLIFV